MKRILPLILLLALSMFAEAAPLKNIPVRLTQPDGKVINCFASGDEFYNYLHDANGFTILENENGYYCYAIKDRQEKVVASNYVVGSVDPASVGLQPYAKISENEYYAIRKEREQHIKRPQMKNGRELNHGLYNNLVVFIRFAGDTYHTTPASTVQEMFNGDDYESNSLHNYYHRTSYNQIDLWSHLFPQPDGETVLSYEDIHPKQYYQPYSPVHNPIGYQEDQRTEREFSLLERAINYIEDMVPTSLDLDYNSDGLVDNVVFVCKGETGEWNSLLWPHRWALFDRDVRLHGLQVWDFNLQLEQGGYFNVSTLCHEMFHSLGAPDLYHYSEGIDPVGPWDLMCGTTEPPQQTSSYMKYKYGNWLDEIPVINPEDPDAFGTYELEAVSWEGGRRNGYLIPTGYPDQFFFIEYRNKHNIFESEIPGSGLLIYRIDTRFDGNASWNGYDYFDEVYLFRPGGTPTEAGDINHAFFNGIGSRTAFNNDTYPYPFLNQYSSFNWPYTIADIRKVGDRMCFDLRPYEGESSGPVLENFTAHVNSLEHQVELSWNTNPDADYYKIYCDGQSISENIVDTTFIYPYTEAGYGYHEFSVLYVSGGTQQIHHAPAYSWAILGNYETIDLTITSDSPYGTKGGELELTFYNSVMKSQYFTVYEGSSKEAEIHIPANTEISFIWHPGFDSDSQGIHIEANHRSTNRQGNIFSIDDPASGTIATYTTSNDGLGFMAPQQLTANNENGSIHLRWRMSAENNRFAIFRDGFRIPSEVTGYDYVDDQLTRSGAYRYHVESLVGETTSWHPENQVNGSVMTWYCEPPQHLQGTHHTTYNDLQWEAPQFVGHGMLAFDDNVSINGINSDNYEWGIKIEPEQLVIFDGHPLSHIELFDCSSGNYTFKIYNGEKTNSSTLIHTQQHEMTGSKEMVRFALDQEIPFDSSLPLWITAKAQGVNFSCCKSVNNPNSCLVKIGSTWEPITDYYFDFSWMLRAYTTTNNANHDFTYNLYWGEEECSEQQMVLGQTTLPSNHTSHETIGNVRYQVTALWNGKETGFSSPVFLGPSVEVNEETALSDNSFAFFNNEDIIINIDNDATLQIIDMTGRIIVTHRNVAHTLSTNGMAPGIYVLRLISGDDVKTQKIVIR